MYFDKRRYVVPIEGGCGSLNTDRLRGMVVHMIVRPYSLDTSWDLLILDKEADEMINLCEENIITTVFPTVPFCVNELTEVHHWL